MIWMKGHGFQESHPCGMEILWRKAVFSLPLVAAEAGSLDIGTLKTILNRMKVKRCLCHPATLEGILGIHNLLLDPHEAYLWPVNVMRHRKLVVSTPSLASAPAPALKGVSVIIQIQLPPSFVWITIIEVFVVSVAIMFVTICSCVGCVLY
jgi:hypothetical protein